MEKMNVYNYSVFANRMLREAKSGKLVYAGLFFDEAVQLIKCLMAIPDVRVGGLNIADYDYYGYDKEYYISLDTDLIIDVEKAYVETGFDKQLRYLGFDADVFYIDGDANSSILKNADSCEIVELFISGKDDQDEEDDFDYEDDDDFESDMEDSDELCDDDDVDSVIDSTEVVYGNGHVCAIFFRINQGGCPRG